MYASLFCSKFPGIIVPDVEINDGYDADLPLIRFCHYKNLSSRYLQKKLFLEHGKTCPSCMNK